MKRVNKITEIPNVPISHIGSSPLAVEVCRVKHSPVHTHDKATELVYCVKGTVNLYSSHEFVELKEGEMFSVNYYDPHCLYSDEDNIAIIIHLDFAHELLDYGEIFSAYIDCCDNSAHPFQKEPLQKVKARLLAVAYTFLKEELSAEKAADVAVNLYSYLHNNFNWFGQLDYYPTNNPELTERLTDVVSYVVNNYTDKLSISFFAKKLNISENYVSQFFKRTPYGSFSLLVGYIRCYQAQRLLLNSEMSVMEIGNSCGFSDYKYFHKNFVYWWNMPPGRYRKWFSEYVKTPYETITPDVTTTTEYLKGYISDFFIKTNL